MSEVLQSKVGRGWTCEEEVFKGRKDTACRNNCGKYLRAGDTVLMLRANKGKRKHAFCSVVCLRQYYIDARAHYQRLQDGLAA